jgi:hypothetical protein
VHCRSKQRQPPCRVRRSKLCTAGANCIVTFTVTACTDLGSQQSSTAGWQEHALAAPRVVSSSSGAGGKGQCCSAGDVLRRMPAPWAVGQHGKDQIASNALDGWVE